MVHANEERRAWPYLSCVAHEYAFHEFIRRLLAPTGEEKQADEKEVEAAVVSALAVDACMRR